MPFEIAGDDGEYHAARIVNANGGAEKPIVWRTNGWVEGRNLILKAEGVAVPKKVRYLHNSPWIGNVFAISGLPLGPFEAAVSASAEAGDGAK